MIDKAKEKNTEKQLWEMYLTLYPNMDKKNFMTFTDFKTKSSPVNKKNLSSEDEVLADVQEIRKKLERR